MTLKDVVEEDKVWTVSSHLVVWTDYKFQPL